MPFGGSFSGRTVLNLQFEGADGSTTITDLSAVPHTVTAVGNAQIDTAQAQSGASSLLLDGTGDYLELDGSSDFAFGIKPFDITIGARYSTVAGTRFLYDARPTTTQGFYPTIYLTGGTLRFFTNGADRITGTTSLSTGVWYTIKLQRRGTSTKLLLNGVQEGSTYTDSNAYLIGASRPRFGESGHTPAAGQLHTGWMDNIKILKGLAR